MDPIEINVSQSDFDFSSDDNESSMEWEYGESGILDADSSPNSCTSGSSLNDLSFHTAAENHSSVGDSSEVGQLNTGSFTLMDQGQTPNQEIPRHRALAAIEMGNSTGSGEHTHRTIIFRHDGIVSAYSAYIRWVSAYEDRNFVRYVHMFKAESTSSAFKAPKYGSKRKSLFQECLIGLPEEEYCYYTNKLTHVRQFKVRCRQVGCEGFVNFRGKQHEQGQEPIPCPSHILAYFWYDGKSDRAVLGHVRFYGGHNHPLGENQQMLRLSLTKATVAKVQSMIAQNYDNQQIYSAVAPERTIRNRDSPPTLSQCAISVEQIRFIRRRMHQKNALSHLSDAYKVDFLVREEGEFFGVRLYEPKVRTSDVFCLVCQTQWQEEVMKSCLRQNPIILMDTTHNITKHRSIFLTTLMVVRPNAEWARTGVRYNGIPVAWMIHENQDSTIYEKILRSIFPDDETKELVKFAMMDEAKAEMNALQHVIPSAKVFWCEWHVKKALRKRLLHLVKDKETKKELWGHVLGLISAESETDLHSRWEWFQERLEENSGQGQYIRYVEENAWRDRQRWSHCFQADLTISTNNHLESFHNRLKTTFLKRHRYDVSTLLQILMTKVEAQYHTREHALSITGKTARASQIERAAKRTRYEAANQSPPPETVGSTSNHARTQENYEGEEIFHDYSALAVTEMSKSQDLLEEVYRLWPLVPQDNIGAILTGTKHLRELLDIAKGATMVTTGPSDQPTQSACIRNETRELVDFQGKSGNGRVPTQEGLRRAAWASQRRQKSRQQAREAASQVTTTVTSQ